MSEADYDQVPEAALHWVRSGRKAALATVIETRGSAPRPAGSQMAISNDGQMVGSVSGGCVEGAVVVEALEALQDGTPRILEFGVSDEDAFAAGLACGGRIRVMVEPVATGQGPGEGLLADLAAARAGRRPVVHAVNTRTWERHLASAGSPGSFHAAIAAALVSDRSGFAGEWFLGVNNPPLRLAVVGAVHIAQALVPMARIAGYDVAVIDPREAFASEARFPGTLLLSDWPDAALGAYGLDGRTAVVTLAHDPKLDDPAIRAALRAPVFYLGCLGSTRTHAKRIARLHDDGYTDEQIARIHAPVGADIGAQSPAEIAVSILAQITERLRRPETRPETRGTRPLPRAAVPA